MRNIMSTHTVKFMKYLLGLRSAETSLTDSEHRLLSDISRDKNIIVEVGVYEGATSSVLCECMDNNSTLYLVDPYYSNVLLEKLFRVSFTEYVAKNTLNKSSKNIKFIKSTSIDAVKHFDSIRIDLVFIDAAHDYESVKNDFQVRSKIMSYGGLMVFHDSHVCVERPDLKEADGPVRLLNEIKGGLFGDWIICDCVDTATVIKAK